MKDCGKFHPNQIYKECILNKIVKMLNMAKQSSKYVFGLEDKNISKLARIQKLIDDV